MKEKFENREKIDFTTRLADFLQHKRRIIIIAGAVVIGAFIAGISGYAIWEKTSGDNIQAVEELYDRYFEMGFENPAVNAVNEEETSEYIASVREFAEKKSGYAAVRAWTILGRVYQSRKEWPLAEEAWSRAAALKPASYLTPESLFNAASAAEEQGSVERAIEILKKISGEYPDTFPGIARSSFSLGRLYEKQEDTEAALSAYQTVVENWPSSPWANLANSRIIALAINR
ncbi:MAG: tetratricopeptide repeat protein [Spirochaetaceae bacterium]|jgi:tetratricopeptide (TPR) repeat protein|nr:tetratricopeptide repeat protein [Spirochaetaceae bacterium]